MIEMQREALEGTKTNAATITTMKHASEAMKAVQKNLYVNENIRIAVFLPVDKIPVYK